MQAPLWAPHSGCTPHEYDTATNLNVGTKPETRGLEQGVAPAQTGRDWALGSLRSPSPVSWALGGPGAPWTRLGD